MRKLLMAAGLMMAVSGLTISANAAPDKDKDKGKGKAKPAAVECPVCKMPLSTKKTKDNPVAVKVKGKTYYCCAKCPMKKGEGGKKK